MTISGMSRRTMLLLLFLLTINRGNCTCSTPSYLSLQLILEYATWRSWEQIVLFAELGSSKNCVFEYARSLITCLSEKGISLAIEPLSNPKLSEVLEIRRHRVGSVVLLDGLNLTSPDSVLKASNKRLFNYYVSWFLVTNDPEDAIIDTILRNLTIGINTDVVVGTAFHSEEPPREIMRSKFNRSCSALRTYEKKLSSRNLAQISGRYYEENITRNLDYSTMENRTVAFYLVHVYKIRIDDNSSLVVDPLGSWSPGSPALNLPVSTELRNNFNRLPIIVGILNGTGGGQKSGETDGEEDVAEIQPLHDFVVFLAKSLNARMEVVPYEKLGTMTKKVWDNLLGGVFEGKVDIGLGYITINDERQRDMSFTHPLIRYTRNIYIRPPESGTMRDIFLQPFNSRMLLCVALMHFLIIVVIGTINYAARNALKGDDKSKHPGLGEATLWCISILCMQGSPWSPSSISGKTALLASLIFALVIYNAYAGFITSILSVQAAGIRTLEDVLRNNFKLGYSDIDDEYVRNANDSDLRQLYIKAFNGRESKLDTTLGLQRAVKGGYGFFVSATLARRALGTSLIQERCLIKEIEVRQTFTIVALPMEKHSPYAKIINLSILRMKERGVIDRIRERMLPDMPQCQALTTFHSARIADVYSAFIILVIGIVTSFCLGVFERIWDQRRRVRTRLSRGLFGMKKFDKNLRRSMKMSLENNVKPTLHRSIKLTSDDRHDKLNASFNLGRVRDKPFARLSPNKNDLEDSDVDRDKFQIYPFQH
ncbi:glutamate receptor 1-like isoform X2 [Venturia canescens]|uniref:glutamate receptor 1-like isoform X2 n=1 Tax=Venturia canescens TaxID=32260 RepID=UPI001C9C7733|nr:glutamate receptor 1-like isoform X2 [Venturia canescens]